MKVSEVQTSTYSTASLKDGAGGPKAAKSQPAGFDGAELKFLELLVQNQGLKNAGQSMQLLAEEARPAEPPPSKPLDEPERHEDSTTLAASISNIQPVASTSHEPHAKLAKDDLSPSDVKWLNRTVESCQTAQQIQGMPWVPIQQVMQAQWVAEAEGGGASSVASGFSERFGQLLKDAYKSGRPIRIELDEQAAMVLRIRNGKVSAEFIANGASRAALQAQVDGLRQRLREAELPVDELSVRDEEAGRRGRQQWQAYQQDKQDDG